MNYLTISSDLPPTGKCQSHLQSYVASARNKNMKTTPENTATGSPEVQSKAPNIGLKPTKIKQHLPKFCPFHIATWLY